MIDYTGLPLATTYTNDILGLTQVLLADDGATTTANLFGLDLIAQDDGSETRVLLADGLGSVRVEMVGGMVETTTTYDPYGKLLAQTGSSGTTYGFTGEQEDAATGLVYLRSRYYNPYLHLFQSRDPFVGYAKLPTSQNGYNYVSGNPVNRIDPTGLCAEFGDDGCWSVYEQIVHLCPECKDMKRPWPGPGGYKYLHEENIYSLQGVLANVRNGWRPTQPQSNLDGISFYTAISPGTPGIQINGIAGLEYLYNFHTGDLTLFGVVGLSRGFGGGETVDITVNLVHNIGNNNLAYSGDFSAIKGNAAYGLGLAGGYSWVPNERYPLGRPGDPYAISLGCSVGAGASVTIEGTEYIPIITTNLKHPEMLPKYHLYEYLYDPRSNNGVVTGFHKRVLEMLEELIPQYER